MLFAVSLIRIIQVPARQNDRRNHPWMTARNGLSCDRIQTILRTKRGRGWGWNLHSIPSLLAQGHGGGTYANDGRGSEDYPNNTEFKMVPILDGTLPLCFLGRSTAP